MKKIILVAMAAILLLTLDSCTRRLTDFTVISTKNVPIGEGVHTDFQKGTKRVVGKDVSHIVLCIPMGYPNMKDAIDRAIEQVPGAIGLVDGVVKTSGWTCFLYGQNKYIVEGTPLFPSEYDYEYENSGAPRQDIDRKKNAYYKSTNDQSRRKNEYQEDPGTTMIFYHQVKSGETLADIAKLYNVTIGDIIKWNKLSDSNIERGDRLTIRISE